MCRKMTILGHQGALRILVADPPRCLSPGQGSSAKGMTGASLNTRLLGRMSVPLKPTRGPTSDPRGSPE